MCGRCSQLHSCGDRGVCVCACSFAAAVCRRNEACSQGKMLRNIFVGVGRVLSEKGGAKLQLCVHAARGRFYRDMVPPCCCISCLSFVSTPSKLRECNVYSDAFCPSTSTGKYNAGTNSTQVIQERKQNPSTEDPNSKEARCSYMIAYGLQV